MRTSDDWEVSYKKRFRANIIVWGMPRDLTTLEIRAKFADLGWKGVLGGRACKFSRDSTKELVSQVSSSVRRSGCRCVLDEMIRDPSLCVY